MPNNGCALYGICTSILFAFASPRVRLQTKSVSAAPNRRGNCAQWVKDAAARYTGGRRGERIETEWKWYIGVVAACARNITNARAEKRAKNENETKHMEAPLCSLYMPLPPKGWQFLVTSYVLHKVNSEPELWSSSSSSLVVVALLPPPLLL